jgi:hypothetical protein
MADRDKDLTHLFLRDLDAIELPPRDAWRGPTRKESYVMKTSRYVLSAGAIAAVLLVALVAGLAMRNGGQGAAVPSVSPAPSATSTPSGSAVTSGPTTTPSGSPSLSPAVLDDRFGFLVTTAAAKTSLRTETGGPPKGVKPGFRADFDGIGFAVSGSGTSIAYWHTAAGGGAPHELRIIRVGEDQEQTLMTLPASQLGGTIVWSEDQSGLLYEVHAVESVGGAGGGPKSSSLESYDLRASQANGRGYGMLTNGRVYAPIAWSRSANLVAAGETGEGGFMSAYVTFTTAILPPGQSDSNRAAVADRMVMGTVHASSDARFVLGALLDSGAIRWWPLSDYAAGRVASASGSSITGAAWQPNTTRFAYVAGDDLVLYDVTSGSATSAARGVRGNSVRTFRPDGSAVILVAQSAGDATILELATGQSATVQARGTIGPWVRFGP